MLMCWRAAMRGEVHGPTACIHRKVGHRHDRIAAPGRKFHCESPNCVAQRFKDLQSIAYFMV